MSATPLESVRNFALSAWTAGSAISAVICSYFASIDCNFSNIYYPGGFAPRTPLHARSRGPAPRSARVAHSRRSFAPPLAWLTARRSFASSASGHRRQKRHLVPVVQRRRQSRVVLVHRARDAAAVVLHRGELGDQRVPR